MSFLFVIKIILIFFLICLVFIYIKLTSIKKINSKIAIEHIEETAKVRNFLIAYHCQVKCFTICLGYYHKTGEFSISFFDPHLKYYLDGEFLSILFEGDMYAIGKIPEGFPVDELREKGKIQLRNPRHGNR